MEGEGEGRGLLEEKAEANAGQFRLIGEILHE